MKIEIELAVINDIDEIENLYNDLFSELEKGPNYSGWTRGIYPTRQEAINGVEAQTLYAARQNEKIVGTMILNHHPEEAYHTVKWGCESDYLDIFVIHTFAVNPIYSKGGVGMALIGFAIKHGRESGMKAIRLDVYDGNIPVVNLYEKCGFKYVETVDLGLGDCGLERFKLYEFMLKENG